ncbi:MAG: hypothetical protein SPLUMA2_SPLUMAMAG2_00107 [uncultured Sulfurimonas sp.]|nr:MAG: hypothetical protein SPLUMA2_SPLUMAMAG2_00107 [uncultured Sulfurimonas sp.]
MLSLQEQIQKDLTTRYRKSVLSKQELAKEMGIGLSTLNKYLGQGLGIPTYKKVGASRNARVLFPIPAVAEFLSQTIAVA